MTDQFDLFAPHVGRLNDGIDALVALRFAEAAELLRDAGPGAAAAADVAERLEAIRLARGKLGGVEQALAWRKEPGLHVAPGLREAICIEAADRIERALGPAGRHYGHLPGGLLLEAAQPGHAAASLERAAVAQPNDGAVWVLFGNARHRLGQASEAREAWFQALWRDPTGVVVSTIVERSVQELEDDASEHMDAGDGDARLWMACLGVARGVFTARPGEVPTAERIALGGSPRERSVMALALLVDSRADQDERPARAALQKLAPWLLRYWLATRTPRSP